MVVAQTQCKLERSYATSSWYAAQVQPRKEELAVLHLQRQKFTTFKPNILITRRRAGRTIQVQEALFPGYVFVAFDEEWDSWRSINGTIGVSRLVMFGDSPARLPLGFVEELRSSADDQGVVRFNGDLKAGSIVRVVGGPLDNVTGTLLSSDSRERVTILVQLLSGPRKVSIRRDRLMAELD